MTAALACIEDQIFILWRTQMPPAEIAARLNVSELFVRSIIEDAGGAVPPAPASSSRPSGSAKSRPSRLPAQFNFRRANAPVFLRVVSTSSRALLP